MQTKPGKARRRAIWPCWRRPVPAMKSWMKKYGWRGLCPIGALPILLLAFIWLKAPESSV
ncbi:putative metabolite transport protein [Erwinia amylovora Ea644]|nr:putative metabolite transport protein [Erwinia amylovora Ea644]CCP08393.1 putative metabolite transport protein [Erwinia amylovora MR1]